MPHALTRSKRSAMRSLAGLLPLLTLAGCGGGGAVDNPPQVTNSAVAGSQTLCFEYYQRCVNPRLVSPITPMGATSSVTCAATGCHDNIHGTGGALRLIPGANTPLDMATTTPAAARASDMYLNYLSSQGEVLFTDPLQSRLLTKPQVQGVLHGGGQIFTNSQDPVLKIFAYWIQNPAQLGEDEFGASCRNLFTPPDPVNGQCNSN
jgi:predicted small lipoprotein YifL